MAGVPRARARFTKSTVSWTPKRSLFFCSDHFCLLQCLFWEFSSCFWHALKGSQWFKVLCQEVLGIQAWVVTGEHWTGSPTKASTKQEKLPRKCLKTVFSAPPHNFRTFFGYFFDIFRTFCRHSLFWAIQRFARYKAWGC